MTKFVIEVERDRCKGCALCVDSCPKHILELGGEINVKGYHYAVITEPEKCIGCKFCAVTCPEVAITIYRRIRK